MTASVYDLVYSDEADRKAIAAQFPAARFEDASDTIHGERFCVGMDEGKRDDYLRFLMETGIARASLTCQIMLRTEPEKLLSLRAEGASKKQEQS